MDEEKFDSIAVPSPTAWPFMTALGLTLIVSGLVTSFIVSAVGIVTVLCSAVGWWRNVLPEQQEELAPVTDAERAAAIIPTSRRAVDHLRTGIGGHRVRIPEEVHPYTAGIYGGLAGAVAMAATATLFGLIAQRSPWYPVNLLAAGVIPSLANAPLSQLREFSASGLIAGSVIHLVTSLLVGMLYAISLPMFPKGAKWRSGLITPLLWSGIVAAMLSVVNPTLNARIDWPWFVGSQIAFGLAAGWVIARSEKIEVMQSWTLIDRAGIEAQRKDSETNSDL